MVFIRDRSSAAAAKGARVAHPAGHGGHQKVPIRISADTRTDVKVGHNINIQCVADMSTHLRWYRDSERLHADELLGIIITNSTLVDGRRRQKLSLLTVEEVEVGDSGIYWCKSADNPQDCDRVRINVVVSQQGGQVATPPRGDEPQQTHALPATEHARAPVVVSSSGFKDTNHTVTPGGKINLKSTSSLGAELVWYRGEERLDNDIATGVVITERADAQRKTLTSFLTIAKVTEEHGGFYSCINAKSECLVSLIIVKVTDS